jgi:hypothetical protein
MKFLWNLLAVVAVSNVLGLLAFVGWLKASDRLDRERLHEVRAVLTKTAAQRTSEAQAAALKAEQDQKSAALQAKAGTLPVTAAESLDLKIQLSQFDQARLEAMRRDVAILQDTLRRERQSLETDRAALAKEREEFERARKIVADTEGSAQFKKTLASYESLKPDKSKLALQQLLEQKQVDQAVSYLDAMQERTRTKIIEEFLKDDPKVATDLLERLRTRGMLARAPESPGG